MKLASTPGYKIITQWLASKQMKPFQFQQDTWQHLHEGNSGLVNAPTGFGKTYSVFLGALINFINQNPTTYKTKTKSGLQLLWVTPLRALAKDIKRAMQEVIAELGMQWQVGSRNGDTDTNERARQKRHMPEVLIITPESLHLLLATKDYTTTFLNLQIIAVDEWHELIGSKRGVQIELAISRLVGMKKVQSAELKIMSEEETQKSKVKSQRTTSKKTHNSKLLTHYPPLSIWGISATIGNLEQAKEVLLSSLRQLQPNTNEP